MKAVILALSIFLPAVAYAKPAITRPLVVAVIDTGLDIEKMKDKVHLCKFGHKDFTGQGIVDRHGHGTHISGLIDTFAGKANYCQVILKYYDPMSPPKSNLNNTVRALAWAIELNVDVINYSGGGLEPDMIEKKLILEALDRGIKVVVAAGNEQSNLDDGMHRYYPAMYDKRIIVVGNYSQDRVPAKSSNWGSVVTVWEVGSKVTSYCINGFYTCEMTGTSQATAIQSGRIIRKMRQELDRI